MKIKYYLSVLLLYPLLNGCHDLDYSEQSYTDKTGVFANFNSSQQAFFAIYSSMQDGFSDVGDAMLESATDNGICVWNSASAANTSNIRFFYDGSWSPINTIDAQWLAFYTGVRRANLFLENADDKVLEPFKWSGNDYQTKLKNWIIYPYEARFLRAFFHFELAKRYGDIPLVTKVLTYDEANSSTRESFENVMLWIAQECTDIAPYLPVSYRDNNVTPGLQTGRVTRGAALALKARALLYLASPLHNPQGDQQKWIDAARAAHDLIVSGLYSNTLPAWGSVFNVFTAANTELILERRIAGTTLTFERANTSVGFGGTSRTTNCPTQNLVDAFEMQANGKGILENGSGYDPNNPYAGRDPRLAMTVLYNGAIWKNRALDISVGGIDGQPKANATPSGYYLRKYMDPNVVYDGTPTSATQHCWILFRYTEVLLNYAEAMNEAYGPNSLGDGTFTLTALDAVNYVRSRTGVNMPPFPAGISQGDFRTKIRNERRVELAFEGQRMWDIRRWKIGDVTREIDGMQIVKQGDGSFTYTPVKIQDRLWDDKMYFYPIPQSEIYDTNSSLSQNPGWN